MSIALYIIGSLAACYVVYVFGYGAIIALGAEYEWVRGRRVRGVKAVLLGVVMMLSFPLFTAIAWGFARVKWLPGFWEQASVAAIITAALYWSVLRAITRKVDAAEK